MNLSHSLGSEQSGLRFLVMLSDEYLPLSVISKVYDAGQPAGSQCSGDSDTTECQCGTECLPWTPGGGSWHCLYTQPLTLLQPCHLTGYCDTGLMCEQGICVRAYKYNLNKWNKTATNKQQHLKYVKGKVISCG